MKIFRIKEKEKYYNSSDIDETNALYRLIIGKRGNGKTFSIIRKIIKAFLENEKPSAYLRRYSEDIKKENLQGLFVSEHLEYIVKKTKGKYNAVEYISHKFHLVKLDAEGNIVNRCKIPILYTLSVAGWEHAKGQDRGKLNYILFDEFCTRGNYLQNEFVLFSNIVSSLIRDRDGTIIYMVANTVNIYSPYWAEMGIYNIEKMKKGQINIYSYNNKDLTVAVEYCADSTNTAEISKYFAFDNPQLQMITNGDWEQSNYRHLQDSFTKNDIYFTFYVKFTGHYVKGIVYKQNNNIILFFHNITKHVDISETDLFYTDEPILSRYHANSFKHIKLEKQRLILNLLNTNRDYYNNNTTGEIINNFKKWGEKIAI